MDEFDSGLLHILADIHKKTGVDASVKPRGGEETVFTAPWDGGEVTLYLSGVGEGAEREAKLVGYLLSTADRAQGGKEEHFKKVLLKEGGSMQALRFLTRYDLEDGECFALDILPEKRHEDALEHIERCLASADGALLMGEHIAVVKFAEEGQTSYEFAQFLAQSLYEEAGIRARIGLGCEMRSFGDIALSYEQAVSATRMSGLTRGGGYIHSYREFLLLRVIGALPKEKIGEYLEQFRVAGAEEVMKDEELVLTAEAFLESDLNLSEASRALFIHRNTLTYRLDKIERLTGLNIRKFSDAVTFRVITMLMRMQGD